MIGRGTVSLPQQKGRSGVRGGPGDDLLEQLRRYSARARERREKSSRPQELQCVQVDVLVSARGARGVLRGRSELGRVEHDEVELPAFALQGAQGVEHVGFEPL